MSEPSLVVGAVRAVREAIKRIPSDITNLSFFGEYDFWRYHAVFDVKLCDLCRDYAETQYFMGKYLRGLFSYLEIESQNVIKAEVHPHCRCFLHRVTDPAEYMMVLHLFGM